MSNVLYDHFENEFYYLVNTVIEFSNTMLAYGYPTLQLQLTWKNLMWVFYDSLHIHALCSLSVSIPTESHMVDLKHLGAYFTRIQNTSINVSFPVANVTVIIPGSNIDDGRSDFATVLKELSSTDVIISVLDTLTIINEENVKFAHQPQEQQHPPRISVNGRVMTRPVSIAIISDKFQNSTSPELAQNITVVFDNINSSTAMIGNTSKQFCASYDKTTDIWSDQTCITSIQQRDDKQTINCKCNRLGVIAVLSVEIDPSDTNNVVHRRFLIDDENTITGVEPISDLFGISKYTVYICGFFIVCFAIILGFIFHKLIIVFELKKLMRKKYRDRRESFHGLLLSGASALVDIAGCGLISIYVTFCEKLIESDIYALYVKILTSILSLPLLLNFLLFTQALRGWIAVVKSWENSMPHKQKRLKLMFKWVNLIICVIYVIVLLLLLFNVDSYIEDLFLYSEIFWFVVMCSACILFVFYSFKLRKVLFGSLLLVSNTNDQREVEKQKKIMKRLTIVSVVLTIFFLMQTGMAGYGICIQLYKTRFYVPVIDVSLIMFDILLQLVYIVTFLYLYIPQINNIINAESRS